MHIARKRFGQNFLHDQNIIYQIISHLTIQANDHWLEIGPGQGALTQPILKSGTKLDVIELDRDLVDILKDKFAHHPNLTLHSGDALRFNISGLVEPGKQLRVVGNLPYNISTPLVFHLLDHVNVIQDMTFMLQSEVVERLCANPGSKSYGRLSIMVGYYCQAEALFNVPPEAFDPIPKVNSAIVRLTPRTPAISANNMELFRKIVAQAFTQRRKTMRNALRDWVSEPIFHELNIDPSRRPETLSINEFVQISNALN